MSVLLVKNTSKTSIQGSSLIHILPVFLLVLFSNSIVEYLLTWIVAERPMILRQIDYYRYCTPELSKISSETVGLLPASLALSSDSLVTSSTLCFLPHFSVFLACNFLSSIACAAAALHVLYPL